MHPCVVTPLVHSLRLTRPDREYFYSRFLKIKLFFGRVQGDKQKLGYIRLLASFFILPLSFALFLFFLLINFGCPAARAAAKPRPHAGKAGHAAKTSA